jgi:thiamine-phosphate pyrophosphorylase
VEAIAAEYASARPAVGVAGIAVMGSIMRASDPAQEMKALLATVAGAGR